MEKPGPTRRDQVPNQDEGGREGGAKSATGKEQNVAKNVATMRSQRATGNAYACSAWGVRRLVANLPGSYDYKKTPRTTSRKKALTPQNHPHGQNKSNTKYLITMKGITVNLVDLAKRTSSCIYI